MSGMNPRLSKARHAARPPSPASTRSPLTMGVVLVLNAAQAIGADDADGGLDFARQVLPVLSENAYSVESCL